jgi:hypothetical protein
MYSSYSFTTSALDGGLWSASHPGRALVPGTGPPVPIGQEAGWAPEPVWTQRIEEISFATAGDRTPIGRSSSPKSDTILSELTRLLLFSLLSLKRKIEAHETTVLSDCPSVCPLVTSEPINRFFVKFLVEVMPLKVT